MNPTAKLTISLEQITDYKVRVDIEISTNQLGATAVFNSNSVRSTDMLYESVQGDLNNYLRQMVNSLGRQAKEQKK
jgi:hypothetical protein